MGRDHFIKLFGIFIFKFQSTRPVWGATKRSNAAGVMVQISIHAPRMGRDVGVGIDVWLL